MKKILSLFLVITTVAVMLFTLTACQEATDAPYGMKLASNTEVVGYTVYVPEDWIIRDQTGSTMAQVSLSDATNMIITHHSNESTVEYSDTKNTLIAYFYGADAVKLPAEGEEQTYIEYSDELLQKEGGYLNRVYSLFDLTENEKQETVSTFTMVEKPSFTTLKKGDKAVAALTLTYTAVLDGATVQQKMVLAYDDAYFYNITFSTSPSLYGTHQKTFATILENFSFDK